MRPTVLAMWRFEIDAKRLDPVARFTARNLAVSCGRDVDTQRGCLRWQTRYSYETGAPRVTSPVLSPPVLNDQPNKAFQLIGLYRHAAARQWGGLADHRPEARAHRHRMGTARFWDWA